MIDRHLARFLRRGVRAWAGGLMATCLLALVHQGAHGQTLRSEREGGWSIEVGPASYYGRQGGRFRRTASGRRFDPNGLTAAHPWLPFGTKVRVTVRRTGRSVVVTINDRIGNSRRIIDLSVGAARRLGIERQGVVEVALAPAA